jgi:beta-mannosidase
MYPVDAPYLDSVRTEVTQTVRRLQHHTSIALWAGNNENEAALNDNWYI